MASVVRPFTQFRKGFIKLYHQERQFDWRFFIHHNRAMHGVKRLCPLYSEYADSNFFYSNEGNPLEPAHIHVRSAEGEAKFWTQGEVRLSTNDGFDSRTLRELTKLVKHNKTLFVEAWNDYFS